MLKNYNPDVLSCLANLSSDEVFTPPQLANQILDLLPEKLFRNKNTTFLDPCCKSGVFLREIAKRLIKGLEKEIPNLQERLNHIYTKQLFAISITELTSLLSRRSVYCSKKANGKYSICNEFKTEQGNILFKRIEHTWKNEKCVYCGARQIEYDRDKSLETHAYQFIHTIKPQEIFNMNFDVIVGNPPYQLNDGGGTGSSAIPIYQKFVELANKLQPRFITMIIPSRWFTGGKGLDEFREFMIKNKQLQILHSFVNAKDCFPGVNIEGGVCYFLINKDYKDKCKIYIHQQDGNVEESFRYLDGNKEYDIFIYDEKVLKIVEQVLNKKAESFSKLVSSRNAFQIGNNEQFKNEKGTSFRVLGRFNNSRDYKYIDKEKVKKGSVYFNKYKIFISKADGAAGQIGNPIPARITGKPVLGNKNDICTETFLVVGPFKSKEEMENTEIYMKTKFFRFLVGSRKNKNMTQDTYKYAPIISFNKKWTDEMLYKYFNLNNEQINYIEQMIEDME